MNSPHPMVPLLRAVDFRQIRLEMAACGGKLRERVS